MKLRRVGKIAMFGALLGAIGFAGMRQAAFAQSGASVVKPTVYVSLDKVPRGQSFEAAVVMKITPGFHMNSHKPSEDYLIPTTITPNPPQGIKVVDTIYPAGKQKTFEFSPKKPLDVYSDTAMVVVKMSADDTAAIGTMQIPATLRYQACNDTMCLPPVKIPVTIEAEIAPTGTAAHHVHTDIFAAAPKN